MTVISSVDARKAGPGEQRIVGAILARAFYDDPVIQWAFPVPARRQEVLGAFFSHFVWAFAPHDEVYVTSDRRGGALWAPPGVAPVRDEDAEEFGRRIDDISGPDATRVAEINALLEANHPQDDCYYLQLVGVDPAAQGRGVGSALLGAVLVRADAEGQPAYLEATSERSRDLYARHGFRSVGELRLPGGPSLWPMWRDPAAT